MIDCKLDIITKLNLLIEFPELCQMYLNIIIIHAKQNRDNGFIVQKGDGCCNCIMGLLFIVNQAKFHPDTSQSFIENKHANIGVICLFTNNISGNVNKNSFKNGPHF